MAVLTQEIDTIREDTSSVSYQKRDFEKEIKNWLDNPCDDNLDRINHIRERLVQSSLDIESITGRIGALTWKISNPNDEVLRALDHMIALSRYLYQGSASLISTYKPLWERDVIKLEIDEFREVTDHLQEVTDDIEMAYFVLPGVPGFDDVTFRGFATVAMPANCVLSAKIKYFREEISTIQEKPAIARNRCCVLGFFVSLSLIYYQAVL